MSLFCKLFGHKPQQDVWSGAEYMRWGNWGTIDGIGREHRSLTARCARCNQHYNAGKVHLPHSMVLAQMQRDQAIAHLHALLNSRRTATQAWDAEHEARQWLAGIGSEAP